MIIISGTLHTGWIIQHMETTYLMYKFTRNEQIEFTYSTYCKWHAVWLLCLPTALIMQNGMRYVAIFDSLRLKHLSFNYPDNDPNLAPIFAQFSMWPLFCEHGVGSDFFFMEKKSLHTILLSEHQQESKQIFLIHGSFFLLEQNIRYAMCLFWISYDVARQKSTIARVCEQILHMPFILSSWRKKNGKNNRDSRWTLPSVDEMCR